jgi:hypothetical protein
MQQFQQKRRTAHIHSDIRVMRFPFAFFTEDMTQQIIYTFSRMRNILKLSFEGFKKVTRVYNMDVLFQSNKNVEYHNRG